MRHVAIFARPPVEGQVKTRLSPALPPRLAVALYEGMLDDVIMAAQRARVDARTLFWARSSGADAMTPEGFSARVQMGNDLGERLADAFDVVLEAPGSRAVIIGADCPDLGAEVLNRAFALLEAHDAVIGPSLDGGYCLIGLRRSTPALFEGIDWSTSAVFEQTMARARDAGLNTVTLPPLADIDTPADLARWIASLVAREPGAGEATHTRDALARMGLVPAASSPGGPLTG
jgi:uncharacterized protein